ncbi:hypothetical protein N0V82_010089 [Gnomoniopsis sp. IMI 355080]|nr:hypothetical protein N0V82_010089 [Gnomoniopsis sp. IMI 355080]
MSAPKEGRKWPATKRDVKNRRVVAAVLVLLALWSLYALYSSPARLSQLDRDDIPSRAATGSNLEEIVNETKDFPTLDVEAVEADEDVSRYTSGQKPLAGQVHGLGRPNIKDTAKQTFPERPGFDEALDKIINLLPSEIERRGLLRPIELTGEQHLRELGMLARKYKKYYEAWEALHVTTDADGANMHIRDDVLPYLRHRAAAGGAGGSATDAESEHILLVDKIHAYEDFRRLLVQLNQLLFPFTAPYFPDHMTLRTHLHKGGRGIVLTAGNDQVAYLLTQIPILRSLGCDLPIEVMYVGDSDLNRDSRQDLEELEGVVTRDISAMIQTHGWNVASWAAKPFAILLSSFREVIFIDADSFFFVNPEVMFEYPEYVKTGALFFRDRLIMPESKKSWLQSILPQPVSKNVKETRLWKGESGHQQESGVLVVDTYRHFIAMLFVLRMNGPDRDGDRTRGRIGVYDMVYGDKETFWLGFELVGDLDYVFHQGDAGIIGELQTPNPTPSQFGKRDDIQFPFVVAHEQSELTDDGNNNTTTTTEDEELPAVSLGPKPRICSPQLLHLDLDGKPLWFNGGLVRNKFLDRREWKFGAWDTYLIEPREIREPGAWFLGDANMCCLTSDHHLQGELSPREKGLLDAMVAQAKKVGIANY